MNQDINRRQFTKNGCAAGFTIATTALAPHIANGATGGRIRVGQIGTAHSHAAGKMQTFRKLQDLYEVVGVVEPDKERRERAAKNSAYANLNWMSEEELLSTEGLQCVAVETDIADLVPTGQRCVDAGMHIHLDKPAGESIAAFRRLHQTATGKNRCIQLGYMFRYNPAFQLAAKAVHEGWLGTVFEVHGVMSKKVGQSQRDELNQLPGGTMYELACHLVDALVWMIGKPTKVQSLPRRTMVDGLADNMLATFEYPKATATIRSSVVEPFGFRRRQFTVVGTEGVIDIRPLEPPKADLSLEKARGGYKRGSQTVEFKKPAGRYDGDLIDLAAVIRGEKKLQWDAEHDLAAHETLLKASDMPHE